MISINDNEAQSILEYSMLGTYAGAQCRDRRSAQAENNVNVRFCLKSYANRENNGI